MCIPISWIGHNIQDLFLSITKTLKCKSKQEQWHDLDTGSIKLCMFTTLATCMYCGLFSCK